MPSADSVSAPGRLHTEETKVTSTSHLPARWV
nr:MAG TPA: hypothetical protein [Caudoviricetes sp.]